MKCLDENTVIEYLRGELSAGRRQTYEDHIDGCAQCRALVSAVVRSSVAVEPGTEVWDQEAPQGQLPRGTMIDHFRVLRMLGAGRMGEVYLCRDTELGRRVALKVVRPDALGSPAAIERFLAEARTTAQFNHPHIVTLYWANIWRGLPYLVLEHLEGQTLMQRLEHERPGVFETMRLCRAIASALAEAHRNQVLHRDLKPANVLLPRDGRLRVVDFGLAKAAPGGAVSGEAGRAVYGEEGEQDQTGGRVLLGTPAYMAPEQWRATGITPAADVWALGLILFELLTGHRPYETDSGVNLALQVTAARPVPVPERIPSVPARLLELMRACLDKDPARRPSAARACEVLDRLLQGSGAAEQQPDDCPFRGLLPFDERHAGSFFGREGEVAALVERMRLQGVLPVVGPSGAGKTSLVQAGVIPRLREQARWKVLRMRPGRRPFVTLAKVLHRATPDQKRSAQGPAAGQHAVQQLAAELAASPTQLNLVLRRLADDAGCRVLLFVDQLEELSTFAEECDAEQQQAFVTALCCAGDDPGDPVRVVFTLRDDFLGRLAHGDRVREALGQLTIVRSPEPDALQRIVTAPLRARGYDYDDDGLVQSMVDAVSGEAAALPLLQFTTQLLWDRRDRERRLLLRSAYDDMGGVGGALARHADSLLEGLSAADLRLARELLLRLVTPEGTRRAVLGEELVAGLPAAAGELLDRLTGGRLLSVRRAPGGEEQDRQLELAHESLIRGWGRLARWIDESREELVVLRELSEAARLWQRRGRRDEEVWQGEALREAWRLVQRGAAEVPEEVDQFLRKGRQRERLRRARRRARLLLGGAGLVAVAVAAVVVAVVLGAQKRQEQRQRAAAQRESARSAMLSGDLLEARAKLRASLEAADSAQSRLLWWRLRRDPLVWKRTLGAPVWSTAYSPGGRWVAAAMADRSIQLFDVRTGELHRQLRGHRDQVLAAAFSADGRQLASGSWDGEVWIWNVGSGTGRSVGGRHDGAVWAVSFGKQGQLASGSYDRTVRIWNLTTRRLERVLRGHRSGVYGVAFDTAGGRLASGSYDHTVRIWDPSSGRLVRQLMGHRGAVHGVAFSPGGKLLASAGADRSVRLWQARSGQQRRVLSGFGAEVSALSFSPDGRLLATGSYDKSARIWDVASGRQLQNLAGHSAGVVGVAFSPKTPAGGAAHGGGGYLVTGSRDRSVRLWRVGRLQHRQPSGHTASVWCLAFEPGGERLVTGSRDGTLRLWEVSTGRQLRVLQGHEGGVLAVAFDPRGQLLASAGGDKLVRLWDVRTGLQQRVLSGHISEVFAVAFDPGGQWLASGGYGKHVRIWDPRSGRLVKTLEGHAGNIYGLAFSPDGKQLASGSWDRTVRLWSVPDWAPGRVLRGHRDTVYGVSFSTDSRRLVSGSADRSVRLWDLDSGTGRVIGSYAGRVYWLAFHPDGHVGVPVADGAARIIHTDGGGQALTLRGHRGEVNAIRFSRKGELAGTVGDDGTVRLWTLPRAAGEIARPLWRAPLLRVAPGRPARLLSHGKWTVMAARTARQPAQANKRSSSGGPAWSTMVRDQGRSAAVDHQQRTLCAVTLDGQLELWSLAEDRRLRRQRIDGLQRVLALPGGCVTLATGGVQFHGRGGGSRRLAGAPASAMALALPWRELLVSAGGKLQVFALQGPGAAPGPAVASHRASPAITAVARTPDWLVLGYRDGSIELRDRASGKRRQRFSFKDVPASPVEQVLAGAMNTLVVGYANGTVGIWSVRSGRRLHHARLHGSVVHLVRQGPRLHAATDLGHHLTWDLGVLATDYCAVMRQVWQQVPVLWEQGRAVLRRSDQHRCTR